MSQQVTICECFARDGLQHEDLFVATVEKVDLLNAFAVAGFRRIEATSYSSPKLLPAFSDASKVLRRIDRPANVNFKATCANKKAIVRALTDLDAGHGADELSLLVSASEGHSQRNLHTTRAQQWKAVAEMVGLARDRFRMIGVISVAFGCPIDGLVHADTVIDDLVRFHDLGVKYVSLGDTTGLATPLQVRAMFQRIAAEVAGITPIAHFHNTRGTGLANCWAAFEEGCRYFDSAFGGVGGHPSQIIYGGGYTGNVATEDLVNLFETSGISTGLDLERVMLASERCESILGRNLHSMVARSGYGILRKESTNAI